MADKTLNEVATPVGGTCATCRYAQVGPLPPPNIGSMRVCRRFPPAVITVPGQRGGMGMMSPFPIVGDECWCYEYASAAANG